jgi:hypothetical protein
MATPSAAPPSACELAARARGSCGRKCLGTGAAARLSGLRGAVLLRDEGAEAAPEAEARAKGRHGVLLRECRKDPGAPLTVVAQCQHAAPVKRPCRQQQPSLRAPVLSAPRVPDADASEGSSLLLWRRWGAGGRAVRWPGCPGPASRPNH